MKVAVITRQLPMGDVSQTIVSALFLEPTGFDLHLDSYFEDKRDQHIRTFTEDFPEFKHAVWKMQILEAR